MDDNNSSGSSKEIIKLEGGRRRVDTNNGDLLRYIWIEKDTGKLLIQFKNQMPEVRLSAMNDEEIYNMC